MRVQDPDDDWLDEPTCPDCGDDLRDYKRYRVCEECSQQYKREVIEVQFRPL